ncbi:MAG: hypothetical protein V4700_04070 [Pseudomonadota bacterium]
MTLLDQKQSTPNLTNSVENEQADNIYPFIIDCSINEKGDIIIYEIQPFIYSGFGRKNSELKTAFEKAFPEISVEIKCRKLSFTSKGETNKKMLITDSYYPLNNPNTYDYIHTPFKFVLDGLCNKISQRLYLPPEASPEYTLFDLSLDTNQEIKRVISFFKQKNITKIVIKHPNSFEGKGNVFIDSIQNENAIKQGVKKIKRIFSSTQRSLPTHLLVEEQKIFPRISSKTKDKKPVFIVYRVVGIANSNGVFGYFIATKSISTGIDSHKRSELKCYFGEEKKKVIGPKWTTRYCGTKDKYFNLGNKKIIINSETLNKVFKSTYKFYCDLDTTLLKFNEDHYNPLVLNKKNSDELSDPEFKKIQYQEQLDKKICEDLFLQLKNLGLVNWIRMGNKKENLVILISIPKREKSLKDSLRAAGARSSPGFFLFLSSNVTITIKLASYRILIDSIKPIITKAKKENESSVRYKN